jgi:hypothetical protein
VEGISGYKVITEGVNLNDLPRLHNLEMLCGWVHCHEGCAMFLQSIFLVVFFIPHP